MKNIPTTFGAAIPFVATAFISSFVLVVQRRLYNLNLNHHPILPSTKAKKNQDAPDPNNQFSNAKRDAVKVACNLVLSLLWSCAFVTMLGKTSHNRDDQNREL